MGVLLGCFFLLVLFFLFFFFIFQALFNYVLLFFSTLIIEMAKVDNIMSSYMSVPYLCIIICLELVMISFWCAPPHFKCACVGGDVSSNTRYHFFSM